MGLVKVVIPVRPPGVEEVSESVGTFKIDFLPVGICCRTSPPPEVSGFIQGRGEDPLEEWWVPGPGHLDMEIQLPPRWRVVGRYIILGGIFVQIRG